MCCGYPERVKRKRGRSMIVTSMTSMTSMTSLAGVASSWFGRDRSGISCGVVVFGVCWSDEWRADRVMRVDRVIRADAAAAR